jgi:DNA polymerase III subunit alpha
LVAYVLKITDIDPLEFNLLFERFINPERISMPDFDIDFCQERRAEVIRYVSSRYGKGNVCQIITFGKLQARAVVKDVARVLGLSFAEADQITKLFPDELDMTLKRAFEQEPRLKERIDADPRLKVLTDYSLKLEGLYRNAGMHAAGVIITERPVVSYCPLFVSKDGDVVTQFDKDFSEAIGLIKFDFLGLKTLTVIDRCLALVLGEGDRQAFLASLPYDDPAVYALIQSGDTDGVFQVESSGMKDLCQRLKPTNLEDITAINALYRPGPLGSGMVDDFIERKHGLKPVVYDVPALEPVLKETYGVIVYQEQVMRIARELAGYSLGQADLLRRAMGKKKADEMQAHRKIFVEGALEQGLERQKAEGVFDLMAKFAEYGFNKSHSAAYGVLTYQTAYLKTHYPAQFMAALMTTEINHTEKLAKYLADARSHGIHILPPDVNASLAHFSVEKKDEKDGIRFGLEAVKGVGGIAATLILETRMEKSFTDLLDFCRRVSIRKVNKKVLEALCVSGAFDAITELNRPSVLASIEGILEHVGHEQQERELGQTSFFDQLKTNSLLPVLNAGQILKQVPDWNLVERLQREKDVVGFYVSGHPCQGWQKLSEEWFKTGIHQLMVREKGQGRRKVSVQFAALLVELKEITTKKGKRMAFLQVEDLHSRMEVVCFPDLFEASGNLLKEALQNTKVLVLQGTLEDGEEQAKLMLQSFQDVRTYQPPDGQKLCLTLHRDHVPLESLRALKQVLLGHRGKIPVRLCLRASDWESTMELPETFGVALSPEGMTALESLLGEAAIELK